MTPTPLPNDRRFQTTRWFTVTQAAGCDAGDARGALVDLCLRYWYPVYAYVRRCGHAPPIAEDITRGFLQHLFRHFREDAAGRSQARFRPYLLARLNAFLASDWRELEPDTGAEPAAELEQAPPDLERRNRRDNARAQSPGEAYQRSFALEVVARAFCRLRSEARQTGHLAMFEALEPYLADEPGPGQYEELARLLGRRPLGLVVALRRLRQRFRELTGEELADTVCSADELQAEQQALYAILCEGAP